MWRVVGGVVLALGMALLAAPATDRAAAAADGRPNILVFMTDDQTYDTLSVMPAVRSLQARGTTFTRYYDSNPLCCPARAAFITGQYSHNNGVWDNTGSSGGYKALVDKDHTLPAWLSDAGYQTGIVGKFVNGWSYDRHGIPVGWDKWRVAEGPVYDYWRTRIRDEHGVLTDYGDTTYKTVKYTELALGVIDEFDNGRPWFLWLTPNAPHVGTPVDPYDTSYVKSCSPSPAWAGFDAGRALPDRRQFNEADVTDKPRHVRRLALLTTADRAAVKSAYWEQLECLRSADEYLGAVLDHLDEIGELDNTDVLFTTDNGFAYGQHRIKAGKRLPYDYSSHLPLVAAGPDFAPGVDDLPRSSVDLAPTVLDLAGATATGRVVDGRSLLTAVSADRVILHEGRMSNRAHDRYSVERYWAVRTPGWLYAHYRYGEGRDERELYDLVNDPDQLTSRGRSEATRYVKRRAALEERLRQLRTCTGDTCP